LLLLLLFLLLLLLLLLHTSRCLSISFLLPSSLFLSLLYSIFIVICYYYHYHLLCHSSPFLLIIIAIIFFLVVIITGTYTVNEEQSPFNFALKASVSVEKQQEEGKMLMIRGSLGEMELRKWKISISFSSFFSVFVNSIDVIVMFICCYFYVLT